MGVHEDHSHERGCAASRATASEGDPGGGEGWKGLEGVQAENKIGRCELSGQVQEMGVTAGPVKGVDPRIIDKEVEAEAGNTSSP